MDRRMERILIVEDDRPLREQIAWSLRDRYAVSQAGDRAEGIATLLKERPDLVLLDLHLPPGRGTREGMGLLREIHDRGFEAIVIVMTGDETREAALRAIEGGAYDYFRKPVDLG